MTAVQSFFILLLAAFTISCGNNSQHTLDVSQDTTVATSNNDANVDSITLQTVAEGFTAPVYLTQPANDNRLFVVDQVGKIYIINNGQKSAQPFLDISSKIVQLKTDQEEERGLLGLAFHPDYKSNGKFYVYYSAPLRSSAPKDWNCTSTIAEYKVSTSDTNKADPTSGRVLLQIDKPQKNHNAGTLAFGPDGFLYISIGDGGGADDKDMGHVSDWYDKNAGGNGQDTKQNLLGNILRIDVNNGNPYGIPTDNPFADGKDGLKEIYAYGLRNPYRFCFAGDGSLIAADAGQVLYEEIDVITKGGNYGWNVKEGRHCFNAADNKQPFDSCPVKDKMGNAFVEPVIEFKNAMNFKDGLGIVSIGGVVYSGSGLPALKDKYLFGVWTQEHDKSKGVIFAADRKGSDWPYKRMFIKNDQNGELGAYLLAFGQDRNGEVYVLTIINEGPKGNTGTVYRLAN